MKPEEFRAEAHKLVDWMADYLATVETRRIVPTCRPGDIRKQLPESAPEAAEPFAEIWADFERVILPGMTHWNHPGWFAYFPANHSPPSILAEMATATLGAQCMSWQTSPAATELEEVTMGWLRELLGLPATFRGVIQDTASTSTFVALLTARERKSGHHFGSEGPDAEAARGLTVYASSEAHSSIAKAVKLAGYGLENLRTVATDANFAMRPDALEAAIQADLAQGKKPACVVATVGTTSSSALDPLGPIGEIAEKYGLWFHVDGAYGGTAAILPEKRDILAGIERADSVVVNPHKWMLVNFDCSAYFVRDVGTLLNTFQTSPAYLRTAHDAEVSNFRDWGIQLGRRFRALKLWFVLRGYGAEGLRSIIREHLRLASLFRSWVEADPDFELVAPTPLALVTFRLRPAGQALDDEALDRLNDALIARINAAEDLHLTSTHLAGRTCLRMSIGQWQTEERHVRRAWEHIRQSARELG